MIIFKVVINSQTYPINGDFTDISFHSTKENALNKVKSLISIDVNNLIKKQLNVSNAELYDKWMNHCLNNIREDVNQDHDLVEYPLYEILTIQLED